MLAGDKIKIIKIIFYHKDMPCIEYYDVLLYCDSSKKKKLNIIILQSYTFLLRKLVEILFHRY